MHVNEDPVGMEAPMWLSIRGREAPVSASSGQLYASATAVHPNITLQATEVMLSNLNFRGHARYCTC
jgi:hypothetical protein